METSVLPSPLTGAPWWLQASGGVSHDGPLGKLVELKEGDPPGHDGQHDHQDANQIHPKTSFNLHRRGETDKRLKATQTQTDRESVTPVCECWS